MKARTLMVVDGNSLVHRGFHAIPHLSTSKGFPSNGVYGFVMIFLNALKKIQPDYVAVTFDLEGPTFRDKLYKDYKATRVKAPQELYDQIPKVKEFVESLNLPVFEKQGYEADDVIGTIVKHPHLISPSSRGRKEEGVSALGKGEKEGVESVIVTGDLDTLQLVDDRTRVFTTKKGLSEIVEYDEHAVFERFGFGPEYLADYKALRGDPSDNIPGVSGIGQIGAIDLVKKFGHVEDMFAELETGSKKAKALPEKLREKLLEHKKEAMMSKKLATIETKVPIKFSLQKTKFGDYDANRALKFLQEMEFKSLIDKLPRPIKESKEEASEVKTGFKILSHNYHLISTQKELDELVQKLSRQKGFVIDTETTSQKEMEAQLLGISVSFKKGEAYYVSFPAGPLTRPPATLSLRERGRGEGVVRELDVSDFVKLLENKHIEKWGHNVKYDFLVLKLAGIDLQPLSFDTMIAAYVINSGSRGYGLDNLAFTRFGHQMIPIEGLIGKGKNQISLAQVPLEKVAEYSCEDADFTWRLKHDLEPELKKEKVEKIYYDIDLPLVPVLALMEKNGVMVDVGVLKHLSAKVERDLEELERKIHKQGKSKFNINSPLQLKEVLFEKLHIATTNVKKIKTGLSTAASELEKMKDLHPIVPLILEYRELAKLKNTYLDALPGLVNSKTSRIHTSFNQTIAATGRLSSTDPNLQNIPVRTELGNKIREAFVAAPGYELLSCDYSQIELRVVAHLSGDPVMGKVFREGKDIHTSTAAEIFDIAESKVTPADRRYAKVINFGILYGLSAYGLTQQVPGVSRDRASAFIDKYFLTYKGVARYVKEIVEETRKTGWVSNPLGRKRFLPEINSSQFQVRSAAERAAINTPIQSLAADVIKVAMIDIAKKIGVENPECKMLLQVHDELVFEVKKDKVADYARKIKKLMESSIELSVPVAVEAKAGKSWGQMEELKI